MEKSEKRISVLGVCAGFVLLLASIAGLYPGVAGKTFSALVLIHLLLTGGAVFCSLQTLFRLTREETSLKVLPPLLFLLIAGVIALSCTVPITARDALIHHLAVPKWWLEKGAIYPIMWHEWSLYPMLLQLCYTTLLLFKLEALTPFYHFTYLIILAALTASFTRRETDDPNSALFSGFLVFSLPICINLASTPLVDLGLAVYCLIAALSLINWLRSKLSPDAVLAGAALGLALGCKPNAALWIAMLAPFFLLGARQTEKSNLKILAAALMVVLALAVAYAPWAVRNYSWIGNPLFPFAKGALGGPVSYYAGAPGGLNPLQQRLMLYGEEWWQVLLIPLRVFFQGADNNPRLFDGRLSPLLLLALISVAHWRRSVGLKMLFAASLCYFLFAIFLAGVRVRYLAPIYAPLAILAGVGAFHLPGVSFMKHWRPSQRALLAILFLTQAAWSLQYSEGFLARNGAHSYLSPLLTREMYLYRHLDEYAAIEFMNQTLPADSLTYLLFTGNRYYYYERPVISSGYSSGNAVISWVKNCGDAECVHRQYKALGVDFVFAHVQRTQQTFDGVFTFRDTDIWNSFQELYMTPIFAEHGYVVWRLK